VIKSFIEQKLDVLMQSGSRVGNTVQLDQAMQQSAIKMLNFLSGAL
jgi:hypothetical protein